VTDAYATPPQMADELPGAAQEPRTLPWKPNPDGPKSVLDAIALAKTRGVVIPEDIRLVVRDAMVPENADATYGGFQSHKSFRWADFYIGGKIPVKIRSSVLESDEAIVAVLAHEMYELNALREMFEERQSIPGAEIIRLIRPNLPGNLHDKAWDEADRLVRAMRSEGPC